MTILRSLPLLAIGALSLAACDQSMMSPAGGPGMTGGTPAPVAATPAPAGAPAMSAGGRTVMAGPSGEQACMSAVNATRSGMTSSITSSVMSPSGTEVKLRSSDGTNWRCETGKDGTVSGLSVL